MHVTFCSCFAKHFHCHLHLVHCLSGSTSHMHVYQVQFLMRIANGLLLFEDLMAKLILNMNMTILFGVAKTLNKTSDIFFKA